MSLVQNSAGNLLQNVLGWEVVLAYNSEKLGWGSDGTLGRTSYGEVLLTRYFRQALLRLKPVAHPEPAGRGAEEIHGARFHRIPDGRSTREKYFCCGMASRGDGQAAGWPHRNPKRGGDRLQKPGKQPLPCRKRDEDPLAAVPPPDRHCGLCQCIPLLFIELKKAHRGCAERPT